MTLLDAAPFDRARARRRNLAILIAVLVVLAGVSLYLYWPYYQTRRTVNHFFDALVHGNFQEAYYIWQANPKSYSMDSFMKDWGPGSAWGRIRTYSIQKITEPPGGHSTGLVVLVRINGIHTDARLWVEKKSQEMSFYQF
ncbi:MAG TPA: hypothetical protein VE996_01410 [Terriglobales bacterium]|nr:hypothetical protein [Terriglobales bacterium]